MIIAKHIATSNINQQMRYCVMKLNNHVISLSPDSPERQEAENILKYTLLLDTDDNFTDPPLLAEGMDAEDILADMQSNEAKYKNNIDKIIFNIRKITLENCSKLLATEETSFCPDTFFGCNPRNKNIAITSKDFFTMLLDDVVMWTYHAVITELFSSCKNIKPYSSVKLLAEKGLCELLEKKWISLNDKGVEIHTEKFQYKRISLSKKNGSYDTYSDPSNYKSRLNARLTTIGADGTKLNRGIPVQYSNLLYLIANKNLNYKWLISTKSNIYNFRKDNSHFYQTINMLTPYIERTTISNSKFVDKIYSYYILEKIFNINLFYNLLYNLDEQTKDEHTEASFLLHSDTLPVLKNCLKLPNVFSRNYFITSAFGYIDKNTISSVNFWRDIDITQRDRLVSRSRENTEFQSSKWLQQYTAFINYMSDFLLPLYKWYFMSLLLRRIEKEFPSYSHLGHLGIIFIILSNWLKHHGGEVLHPCKCKIPCSFQDISYKVASKENICETINLPFTDLLWKLTDKSYDCLFPFCNNQNIELNPSPINRKFFKGSEKLNDHINLIKYYIDILFMPT